MNEHAFQAPAPEFLAELLPQYDIEYFIAQGGMGAVYKGRQISLDRPIAIKVLPREMGESEEFRESFISEAKAMARLNHPNLLGVFDYGDVEGMPYIVMEYVEGGSLHEASWNQVVEASQAAAIVKGICEGLAHAHEHEIVHRDIKPSNILLTPNIEPKVADFGLAHSTDSDTPGLVMGTPGYTAPEVFQDPGQAGKLADIYSVGVIFHQLLTGIDPSGSMVPPTQGTGNIRLDAIWRKAVNVQPSQRYPSVAAMAADLEKWIAAKQKAPVATSSAPLKALRRPGQMQPASVGGGGGRGVGFKLLVIAILGVLVVFTYQLLQGSKQDIKNDIVDLNGTHPSGTTTPAPKPPPVPIPLPEEDDRPMKIPDPEPTDIRVDEEPENVVEVAPKPEPEPEPVVELPPGDPVLRERAIGLILDARKKRDKELSDNASALQSSLKSLSLNAESDERDYIEKLGESIVNNRIPLTEGVFGIPDKIGEALSNARAKEDSAIANHLSDLTRIRDAYVSRLEGAAAENSDEDLSKRLLAQAERAGDLQAWVKRLAPEPEPERLVARGFGSSVIGKWDNHSYNNTSRWIAHPDGKMEIVGEKWEVTWELLQDGTLKVEWGKKAPYLYTRNGDDWVGTNPHGGKASLTRGDW